MNATATKYDLDLLRETIGGVAVREFEQSRPSDQATLYAWATETLSNLDDSIFVTKASYAIWDSANVSRFPGFFEVHCKASAFYHESARRHALAHPDEDCNASSLYDRAYNDAVRDAGHSALARDLRPCTCATTREG